MISSDIVTRALGGLALSIIIAGFARMRQTLSTSGVIAAVAVATATAAAGWVWASTLLAFFLSSTLLSKVGAQQKKRDLEDIVEKGTERDAWQVLANGGLFASLAIASLAWPAVDWTAPAAGAIAASNADTWATEIGALSRRPPRSVLSFRAVPAGTSGAVTLRGIAGSVLGASFIAGFVILGGWPLLSAYAALIGGVLGSFVDSLLGATVQEKRWCPTCGRGTERAVHTCGTTSTHSGGVSWIDNDAVNFLSSVTGALLGSLCIL